MTKALFEDFDTLHHLSAIEDLYLMRRGDTMSHFADVLFAKVCSSLA
jgi:gamma-tubulin complex component 5